MRVLLDGPPFVRMGRRSAWQSHLFCNYSIHAQPFMTAILQATEIGGFGSGSVWSPLKGLEEGQAPAQPANRYLADKPVVQHLFELLLLLKKASRRRF